MYADLKLIRACTPEDEREWRPVAVNHFQKVDKNLYYINARHATKDGLHKPTIETIEKAIEDYKPQLVIIEGVPTAIGVSPAPYVKFAEKDSVDNFLIGGEPVYALLLAHKNNIPFVGGEPTDIEIFSAMEKEGYSLKDMMAFYLLRAIPRAWIEKRPMSEEGYFQLFVDEYLGKFFEHVPEHERLTLAEFEEWYATHRDKRSNPDYLAVQMGDMAPWDTPTASYFQTLNYRLGMVREEHLDTLIGESMTNYDRVLVVYGDGHFVQSRAVFEKMLGPVRNIQFVNDQPPPSTVYPS